MSGQRCLAFSVSVALLTFVVSWRWLPVEPIERGTDPEGGHRSMRGSNVQLRAEQDGDGFGR